MASASDGAQASNENKMSDGGRWRASLELEMSTSSQKWSERRSAVRSIAWLGRRESMSLAMCEKRLQLAILLSLYRHVAAGGKAVLRAEDVSRTLQVSWTPDG